MSARRRQARNNRGRRDGAAPQRERRQDSLTVLSDALTAVLAREGATLDDMERLTETTAALRTLKQVAPSLHRHPELLAEIQQVVTLAEARAAALDLPIGPSGSVGASGMRVKASPTGATPVASMANMGSGLWTGSKDTPIGVPNAAMLRQFADKNPWVQAARTTRKQQIGRAAIAIEPMDVRGRYDTKVQQTIEGLLAYPNEYRDSYRSLMERVIDDILVLDRGCVSKSMDARRRPHALYAEDGATIKIYPGWDGDPAKPRYLYEEPSGGGISSQRAVPLRNDELICIMANDATYRFGLSPVQVLWDTIQADLRATKAAADIVSGKPPQHLINLKGANQKSLTDIRNAYEMQIAGRKELFFMGAEDLQVFPMVMSLKDNQFMEWQLYLARKICAVFQISPQQLGITFDINKATAETQQDIFEDSGLIPLLLLIEEYWNRELLADYAPVTKEGRPDMDALNLRIFFPEVSEVSRMLHAERTLATAMRGLAGLPVLTPNMALAMIGEEPIPGGNTLWLSTKNGPIPFLSYDGETGDYGQFASLGGGLGAQDPDGGPADDANAPKDSDHDSEKLPQAQPTGGGSNGGGGDGDGKGDPGFNTTDGGASSSSGSSGAVASTSARVAPEWLGAADLRRPGTRWQPSHTRRVAAMATSVAPTLTRAATPHPPQARGQVTAAAAARHTVPHGRQVAQQELETQVQAMFAAARARGAGG